MAPIIGCGNYRYKHGCFNTNLTTKFKFITLNLFKYKKNLVALRVKSTINKQEAADLWEIYKNIHK
jgi:hypothetical protein